MLHLTMPALPAAAACLRCHTSTGPDESGCQVRTIERVCEIPHEGPFCDLMWSDPEDIDTWAVSPRGAGWLFGARVTAEFNRINGLDLVCRAHQLVQEGLKFMFTGELLTCKGGSRGCVAAMPRGLGQGQCCEQA